MTRGILHDNAFTFVHILSIFCVISCKIRSNPNMFLQRTRSLYNVANRGSASATCPPCRSAGDEGSPGAAQAHRLQSPARLPWLPHNRRRDRGLREGERGSERQQRSGGRRGEVVGGGGGGGGEGGGGGLQSRLTGHTAASFKPASQPASQPDRQTHTGRQEAAGHTQRALFFFKLAAC